MRTRGTEQDAHRDGMVAVQAHHVLAMRWLVSFRKAPRPHKD